MSNIRFPHITAPGTEGQLQQMRAFLFQLVEELNYTLQSREQGQQTACQAEQRAEVIPGETVIEELILKRGSWVGSGTTYTQRLAIRGVGKSSLVNLAADAEALAALLKSRTAIYLENENGSVTAVAIGSKPEEDLTVQAVIVEQTTQK